MPQRTTPSPSAASSDVPQSKGTRRRRLVLVLASLVAAAVLSEVAVRVYSAAAFPRMMRVDTTLGWRHLPSREKPFTNEDGEEHLCRHDEHGHRPLPESLASPSRTTRVLVLGDSFAEAIQVASEDSFTSLLAEADPSLDILNAGVGGYSTVQQYLYLRGEGAAFSPDLVLLVAYENDLTDNCIPYSPGIGARPWAELQGDEVRIIEDYDDDAYLKFVAPVPFSAALIRHSYLFYAFNDRVWRRHNKKRLSQLELEDWSALDEATTRRVFLGMVDRMHDLARERGAEFAMVLIPSFTTVKSGGDPWHGEVAAHANARGFPFASLQPALSDPENGRCYFETDIHWTRQGHAVAAEVILPVVHQALGRTR